MTTFPVFLLEWVTGSTPLVVPGNQLSAKGLDVTVPLNLRESERVAGTGSQKPKGFSLGRDTNQQFSQLCPYARTSDKCLEQHQVVIAAGRFKCHVDQGLLVSG